MIDLLTKTYQFANIRLILILLIIVFSVFCFGKSVSDSITKTSNQKFVEWMQKHTHTKYAIDGNYSSGNVNRFLFSNRLSFYYLYKIYEFNLTTVNTYGTQNKIKTENDFYYGVTSNIWQEAPTYIWGNISTEKSYLRGISERNIVGLGCGFNIIKKRPKNQLSITYGYMYESTNYTVLEDMNTFRFSLRLKGRHPFGKNKFQLNHETFLQPSIVDGRNYRYRTLISLDIFVNKYVSFKSSFLQTYENLVNPKKKQRDRNITFGFTFTY